MLYRVFVVVAALVLAGPAHAEPRASTEGTITAWSSDQTRVLGVRTCTRTRDGYDYGSCERELRWRLLTRLCAREGRGKHTYFLQLGNGPRLKASIVCED